MTVISFVLAILSPILGLWGYLISPKDNFFVNIKNKITNITQTQQIKDSPGSQNFQLTINAEPGSTVNIDNEKIIQQIQAFKEGTTTKEVINKLLEISQIVKDGNLDKAIEELRNFEKNNLSLMDLANIQSTRAFIYIAQGRLKEAKAVYEAILDTGIKSNAVYIGMGNILSAESVAAQEIDRERAEKLLYDANDYYYNALDIDKRPIVLVWIYYALYENFYVLNNNFGKNESENLVKYKNLFEENNLKAGNPYIGDILKTLYPYRNKTINLKCSNKKELSDSLKQLGVNMDISALPEDRQLDSCILNLENPREPFLEVNYKE